MRVEDQEEFLSVVVVMEHATNGREGGRERRCEKMRAGKRRKTTRE